MQRILTVSRRPDITFYPNGRIDITARIARAIKLQHGDVIDIAINGSERYIYVRLRADKVNGRHTATVYATKKRSHNFRCYSRELCRAMIGTDSNSILRCPAGKVIEHEQYGKMMNLIYSFNITKQQ